MKTDDELRKLIDDAIEDYQHGLLSPVSFITAIKPLGKITKRDIQWAKKVRNNYEKRISKKIV